MASEKYAVDEIEIVAPDDVSCSRGAPRLR